MQVYIIFIYLLVFEFKSATFVLCEMKGKFINQSCIILVLQISSEMADFKMALILVLVFCLLSNGLGMSLAGKNVDENSVLARFFRGLDKRTVLFISISE